MSALVVGAGFSGLTAAVMLAEKGAAVEVVESRPHIGGNAHDCIDAETGVRYHPYGPHLFHTNSDKVFEFLSKYTEWCPYTHRVRAKVGGEMLDFPINMNTLRAVFFGETIRNSVDATKLIGVLASLCTDDEDDSMRGVMQAMIGGTLFNTFYRGYSEKQWGRSTGDLPAPIAKRIPVRFDFRNTYFDDKYQCLPKDGYSAMFDRMVDDPKITVKTSTEFDVATLRSALLRHEVVVYTGPIDALFEYRFGRLEYRSLSFELIRWEPLGTDVVVNYPDAGVPYTRETEFGLMPNNPAVGVSLLVREYPSGVGDPYYPVPDERNRETYRKYAALAKEHSNLLLIGRLAEYQYYNMDQVVASAISKVRRMYEPR